LSVGSPEIELLADDKKATHRMLLPVHYGHGGGDRAGGRPSIALIFWAAELIATLL
jgi:hypothetical protein